ncbi:MAG: cyclic nucleotide-binding domain-containing protein [Armatimonadetes bacterium]|nr:cyclic nucleotide-binding domain-containing protein [Armatimonadota bacterium]
MTMTKKRKVELVRGVPLFAGMTDRSLQAIASRAQDIEFAAGQYIVRQGQIGTGFYLIVSGRARVVRGGQALAHLGPGDFFGELSVLDQQPRTAHVVAHEPTVCLGLASWDFARLLERNPKITLALLREVARRLRATSESHRH